MITQKVAYKRIYLLALEFTGGFALIAQLYLIILNRVTAIPETIIRYFSFFTILTNILVAVCCTILLLSKKKSLFNFFSNPKTITAITVYITVVGLVYNLILRFLWRPQGLQLLVDELLHTLIPASFILFWLLFVPKARLKTKIILKWLMYPFIYIVYILVRGAFSGFYPYPFIDVKTIGYNKVFLNNGILVIVFVIFSFLFVAIHRFLKRKSLGLEVQTKNL